jgi:hypothetical protein
MDQTLAHVFRELLKITYLLFHNKAHPAMN